MITREICIKYKVEYIDDMLVKMCPQTEQQTYQVYYNFYKKFLNNTDYEMAKAFEYLFNDPNNFLSNIVVLQKQYADVISCRIEARTWLENHKNEE